MTLSPARELAAIRAEISRLRLREAALLAATDDPPARLAPRQGWPIQRSIQPQAPPNHA